MEAFLLERGSVISSYTTEENDTWSPNSHYLSVSSSQMSPVHGLLFHPMWTVGGSNLVQAFCRWPQLKWVHEVNDRAIPSRHLYTTHAPIFWFLHSVYTLLTLFRDVSWALGGYCCPTQASHHHNCVIFKGSPWKLLNAAFLYIFWLFRWLVKLWKIVRLLTRFFFCEFSVIFFPGNCKICSLGSEL